MNPGTSEFWNREGGPGSLFNEVTLQNWREADSHQPLYNYLFPLNFNPNLSILKLNREK